MFSFEISLPFLSESGRYSTGIAEVNPPQLRCRALRRRSFPTSGNLRCGMNIASAPRNYAPVSMRSLSWLWLVLILAPGPTGCRDNPPVVYPTIAPLDETKLTLGPGDKLELVIFFGARESKATYTLDASGQMEVQYIGAVHAGGKIVGDVKTEIVQRLKDGYINDPIVSLTVVEVNSRKLSVFGQVSRSGTIKFTPGMTI